MEVLECAVVPCINQARNESNMMFLECMVGLTCQYWQLPCSHYCMRKKLPCVAQVWNG